MPPYLKGHPDGVRLAVKLQPKASRTAVGGTAGEALKVFVTAPPVDSAANEALVELLAGLLECSRGAVQILRGHTSRHKTVLLRGATLEQVAKCLAALEASASKSDGVRS